MNNKDAYKLLYQQKIQDEIYPINPDGESKAKLEMISQINTIDSRITCFSDIELGPKIKNDVIAQILLDYFYQMESCFTKEVILRKINAKKHPEIIGMALEEFNKFSPFEKTYMTGLQEVICSGEKNDEYINLLFSMVESPDDYASGLIIRKKLLKIAPERLRPLSFSYNKGLLLMETIPELYTYGDIESADVIRYYSVIDEWELNNIIASSTYQLCITFKEKYQQQTTLSSVLALARSFLKRKFGLR